MYYRAPTAPFNQVPMYNYHVQWGSFKRALSCIVGPREGGPIVQNRAVFKGHYRI